MSFHSAQPHENGPSGNFEPLGDFSQCTDGDSHELSVASTNEQRTLASSPEEPDDEARFELLSAYLDDEVTAKERQLVAQWLRDDPSIQKMYQQLLMLRQAIRTSPVPEQPPLQVPSPPNLWDGTSSGMMRWTLACAVAISLLGGLSQLSTASGRQHLKEAWQFIKTLPEGTLLELASTTMENQTERPIQFGQNAK
ncbi:MAG: hypothetical protein AAF572_26040 [Cyanobacteria bacterium P01_B01_bin.77]